MLLRKPTESTFFSDIMGWELYVWPRSGGGHSIWEDGLELVVRDVCFGCVKMTCPQCFREATSLDSDLRLLMWFNRSVLPPVRSIQRVWLVKAWYHIFNALSVTLFKLSFRWFFLMLFNLERRLSLFTTPRLCICLQIYSCIFPFRKFAGVTVIQGMWLRFLIYNVVWLEVSISSFVFLCPSPKVHWDLVQIIFPSHDRRYRILAFHVSFYPSHIY